MRMPETISAWRAMFSAAEKTNVAGTNVGNDRYCWTGNRGEPGNLAGAISCPPSAQAPRHFLSRKYRKWQANEVVVIARGCVYTTAAPPRRSISGGSFTDRSSYPQPPLDGRR